MAFDWIAVTALVVGIGSLALTWQSTRAAKRSIDTSIEIYENQKKDEEQRRIELDKRKLISMKNTISYQLSDYKAKFMEIYRAFDLIKNNKIETLEINVFGDSTIIVIMCDDTRHQACVFLYDMSFSNEFINDLFYLDPENASKLTAILDSQFRYKHIAKHIIECIAVISKSNIDIDFIRESIITFDVFIEDFKSEIEEMLSDCNN